MRFFGSVSVTAAAGVALILALGGCENKYAALTPELQATFADDLKNGKQTLDCGQKCLLTWLAQVPSIHQLDLQESWTPLADRVMQIGYGNDLAYYYLGQAAQGLGYHRAAISYYDTSLALATGPNPLLKCGGLQNDLQNCQGVDLVSNIPVLVKASNDVLAQQQAEAEAEAAASETPAPVHHKHPPKTVATNSSGWTAPPPATPVSSTSTTTSSASTWSAPPPAQ